MGTREVMLRSAYLASYFLYCLAWIVYFRLFWFDDPQSGVKSGIAKMCLMWIIRFIILLHAPVLILQIVGFVSFFPQWAADTQRSDDCHPVWKNGPRETPFLVFRVVSRGDDPHILQRGIDFHEKILIANGIKNYLYQLVVEKSNGLSGAKIEEILVPKDYKTPKNTLYKARNLAYANFNPTKTFLDSTRHLKYFFIIHLDEETLITELAMQNLVKFAKENQFRAGHGLITYGWNKVSSWLSTYTDTWQVSLNASLLYTTFRVFHRSIIWKGGYMVLRNDLAKEVTWDFGETVICEDFHLARMLDNMDEPVQFIDGVIMEESPRSVVEIIKQRSRWLRGIHFDLTHSNCDTKYPIVTWSFILLWATVPIIMICYVIAHLVCPLDSYYPIVDDIILILMANDQFNYFYGAMLNFKLTPIQRFFLTLATLTTLPMLAAMMVESAGVFHAIYIRLTSPPDKLPEFNVSLKGKVIRTASNRLQ